VRGVELVPAVVVGVQYILDVRCTAMEVHVVAADLLDKPGRGPHADAPAVSVVRPDLIVPLKSLLSGDGPEIPALTPRERLPAVAVQELRTDPVGLIMVALVVSISSALPRTDRDVTLWRDHRDAENEMPESREAESEAKETETWPETDAKGRER